MSLGLLPPALVGPIFGHRIDFGRLLEYSYKRSSLPQDPIEGQALQDLQSPSEHGPRDFLWTRSVFPLRLLDRLHTPTASGHGDLGDLNDASNGTTR